MATKKRKKSGPPKLTDDSAALLVRFPAELREALRGQAAALGVSEAHAIREAVRQWLLRREWDRLTAAGGGREEG